MGAESRSSKYLLLQVWCGLLTVAMVVMAAVLTSIKLKTAGKDGVATLHPGNTSQTAHTVPAPYTSKGSSLSYIQLTPVDKDSWQIDYHVRSSDSRSLVLRKNSVHCTKSGLYFFYAQVEFSKRPETDQTKSVTLTETDQTKSVRLERDSTYGKRKKVLVEGTFPVTAEGSVWVSRIIRLEEGDSVSFFITDNYNFQKGGTYWGAYQLG